MVKNKTINVRNNDDIKLWEKAKVKAGKLNLSLTWVIWRLLAMWSNDEVKVEAE